MEFIGYYEIHKIIHIKHLVEHMTDINTDYNVKKY